MALFKSPRPGKPPPTGQASRRADGASGELAARIAAVHPGFFGKVPTYGDFVTADLDPRFQNAFDAFLQQGMAAARQSLGERFEPAFLAAPTWRFTMAAGICGPLAMTGLVIASRDRIGRCFPLVVASRRSLDGMAEQIVYDENWFMTAEAIGRTGLHDDFDLAIFRQKLRRIRPPRDPGDRGGPAATAKGSLWWTTGGPGMRPMELAFEGLPPPVQFVDFVAQKPLAPRRPVERRDELPERPKLSNDPGEQAEDPRPAEQTQAEAALLGPDIEDRHPSPPEVMPEPEPAVRSTPQTPPGRDLAIHWATRHHTSEASRSPPVFFVTTDDPPLSAVLAAGTADRFTPKVIDVVAKVLGDIPAHETLEQIVDEVKGKLGRVHSLLKAGSMGVDGQSSRLPEDFSISLALAVQRSGRLAVMWIGDCRAYMVRDGMMRCLTRDHVTVGMRRSLSRSIGGSQGSALVDTQIEEASPGDRLLLCSQAIPKVLSERAIAELLLEGRPAAAAEAVIQDAILAGSMDTMVAIVGEVGNDSGKDD